MLRSFAALALAALAAAAAAQPPTADEAARFDRHRLPATERQSAILTVPSFGRYSISVESAQGTALQLVDRMAGPGEVVGKVAEEDGRLDVFLDRGDYKVLTHGHEKATGEVELAVHDFRELAPEPLRIVEHKLISTHLEDYTRRSWWIHVEERRRVVIDAAGRHLQDLRLWQNGAWLVDAAPIRQVIAPRSGQPLLLCRLTAELNPGLYRLTAYGGVSQDWAEDSGERPLYLRFGIPTLADAVRRRFTTSPFGFDRYLVPGTADFFRLELPEPRPATIEVGWFDPQKPFQQGSSTGAVEKESLPPVSELKTSRDATREHVVTVSAEAGQPYLLQCFTARRSYLFKELGDYWVSTIHSGHPADSVDATGLLVRIPKRREPIRPLRTQVIEVGKGQGWARRANLLDSLTLHLRIADTGTYEILSFGTEARFKIEPFFVSTPPNYESPPWSGPGSTWDLDAGFYVLTVEPVKKGILDFAVRPRGWLDSLKEMVGLDAAPAAAAPLASVRFGPVHIDRGGCYQLFANVQPEVTAGFIVRPVPLDLARRSLPLTQRPGEVVGVPFTAYEGALLQAVAEDGSRLEIAVDDGAWSPEARVESGLHRARIRHTGEETVVYTLSLVPERLLAEAPLPPVPQEILASLPDFPVLTDREPRAFDLERGAAETFLVRADEPALYRLETTGLLATQGNLRTRVVTSLVRQAQNGVGRNFLVQQYLREGDYQISVAAQGKSAGHLGVELLRTAIHDGGLLSDGVPARGFLPAGEAVAYRVRVDEAGRYRLRSIGVGRTFRARLEDDDGWPLMAPSVQADLVHELEPGDYRLIVLPESVAARQLTLLERVAEPPHHDGRGPHDLPLGARLAHRWHETGADGERPPDVWRFSLPAEAGVAIVLTQEMQAEIYRGNERIGYVPPERNWKGRLDAGDYELRVTSFRVNNQVDYEVGVRTEELVAGQTRAIRAPGWVWASIGEGDRLAEVTSFGSADVRGRLYDREGRLVAASDDRPGDWNFLLTERLAAGYYQLRVDPVGTAGSSTYVTLEHPEERQGQALRVPGEEELRPGRGVATHPLHLPPDAEALVLQATSAESIGISLERAEDGGWRTVATRVGRHVGLEMPRIPLAGRAYRLRVWSLDQRGNPVRLVTAAGAVAHVDEAKLAKGVVLDSFGESGVGLVAVDLERPGCFDLASEDGVRFTAVPERVATAADGPVPGSGAALYLAADLGSSRRRLSARRLTLQPGAEPLLVRLPAGGRLSCDVASGEGAVVVTSRAVVGSPGIAIDDGPLAAAPQAALAVALAGERPVATSWSGEDETALELRLEAWRFPLPEAEEAGWGLLDGELAETSRAFALPPGEKRLRLVLAPSVAAVLATGGRVQSVHWADRGKREEVLDTAAESLFLFRLGDGEGRFRADVLPVDERHRLASPVPGRPFEHRLASAGALYLPIAPVDGVYGLHVRGAEDATFLGGDGSIARGRDFTVAEEGGTLRIDHGPGVVLAWLDRPGREAEDLWGAARAEARSVELPATVPLLLDVGFFELAGAEPRVLHLRSSTPLVTRLETGDGDPIVEVHPASTSFDAYLPEGAAHLAVRALGGGRLDGTLELSTSAVLSIGEGLGPEILLAAGETRLFAFEVEEAGAVGLGVRADADVVETVLLDAGGRPLGRGVVQMHELEPGVYLLQLTSPADAPPLGARPIVVGLERPATGPPEEVVRSYLAMARADAGQG